MRAGEHVTLLPFVNATLTNKKRVVLQMQSLRNNGNHHCQRKVPKEEGNEDENAYH